MRVAVVVCQEEFGLPVLSLYDIGNRVAEPFQTGVPARWLSMNHTLPFCSMQKINRPSFRISG
jgi:hypothetical protein